MSDRPRWGGDIRKLWSTESNKLRDHLLRLNPQDRRLRFGHAVSDAFIDDYAARIPVMDCITYAYVEGGAVRAVAEMRKLGLHWGEEAEAAFSVEQGWQNRGIGTALMGRIICSARNRGVNRLMMGCLVENTRIVAIARKHKAQLAIEDGEMMGRITPPEASFETMLQESIGDRLSFIMAVMEIPQSVELTT